MMQRGWLLDAWCPVCSTEIPGVEQFAEERFCCTGCRSELVLTHDCYEDGDCCDYALTVEEFARVRGFTP
jgi:hypothetical protein